jgi:iron complex transport system substrate-binding protein
MLSSKLDEVWSNNFPPNRVVSLVPSTTESLFELGWGNSVVGVTDYCIHPAVSLKHLTRVGGTKNPQIDKILELEPDLVLANKEENSKEAIEALVKANVKVWLTFPKTVRQALEDLNALAYLFQDQTALHRIKTLIAEVEKRELAAANRKALSCFCPIWQSNSEGEIWWMTFNRSTYPHDILRLMGFENCFANRRRRYPLSADLGRELEINPNDESLDRRYPRVSLREVRDASPQVILLPDEPFLFEENHREEIMALLPEVEATREKRIYLVDGSLLTWHGIRLERALEELPLEIKYN